jgi:hypothetical protein
LENDFVVRWSKPECYDFERTGPSPIRLSYRILAVSVNSRRKFRGEVYPAGGLLGFAGEARELGRWYTGPTGHHVANLYGVAVHGRNGKPTGVNSLRVELEVRMEKEGCSEVFVRSGQSVDYSGFFQISASDDEKK